MRLFVYEYACAQPASVALPASVRREGRAMFEAVVEDARRLEPDVDVVTMDEGLTPQDCFRRVDYALMIAPEFDGILEKLAQDAVDAGCGLLGPLPAAIALTADKWALYEHWKTLGMATPRTWLPGQLPNGTGLFIKKHRYGAGSLGVGWWKPGEPLEQHELVQEYVAGEPVSVALLVSSSGQVTPLLPTHQHIGEDFGYLGGRFLDDPDRQERTIKLALMAVQGLVGLQGYVGVDAILGENGQDVVLEINPRLTTSYLGLRRASPANLVRCMLDVVEGRTLVPLSWSPRDVSWQANDGPCRL